MENYIRIPESVLQNEELTIQEKFFLGKLHTYQMTVDGNPTGNYCFDTQENIAKEIGMSVITFKRMLKTLTKNGYIFLEKKRDVVGGKQYKNRKAIVMVDKFNPNPIKETIQLLDELFLESCELYVNEEINNKENDKEIKKVAETPEELEKVLDDTYQQVHGHKNIEDETYSGIQHKCGLNTFNVKTKHISIYEKYMDKKGFLNRLNKCHNQTEFDIELQRKLEFTL